MRGANAKFRRRWSHMEHAAWESGRDIADLSIDEQEALWAEAKEALAAQPAGAPATSKEKQ